MRKPGPEIRIEDAVAKHVPNLFLRDDIPFWAGGSVPIGAGMPDLLIASYNPEVFALAQIGLPDTQILGYLRAVKNARLETIVERVGKPKRMVTRCLNDLVEMDAIKSGPQTFALSPKWRTLLPEITAVEAKVSNWRRAIEQATRNSIFAHRSYVALPENVARRAFVESSFQSSGIGIISVADNDEATIIRRSRSFQPKVWYYYYQLAHLIANPGKKIKHNALHSSNDGCTGSVSKLQIHQAVDA
ncbi:MAG: hypothetical protein EOO88_36970 [Pedobacter sp.]|nr:MAG: hypothetical protein EOO88_36970 [Pedobacter sp.]